MQPPTTPSGDRIPLQYRVLLWCYPRSLRRTFGRELWQFVARQRMERRYRGRRWGGGGLRFWTDVVFDAVLTGLRMRWRALLDRRTSQRRPHLKTARRIDIQGILQDIRVSARSLLRAPTYTVVAVLTLALGIGATTAIFSVVHSVILRPLPYPNASELVVAWRTGNRMIRGALSYPDFEDWRKGSNAFAGLGGYADHSGVFAWDGEATALSGLRMSFEMFPLLGVHPAVGRWFTEDEDLLGGPRAVMLSHGLWQRRFGADSGVVGQTIRIEGQSHAIVGVMPADFFFPIPTVEYWTPLREDELLKDAGVTRRTRNLAFIDVVARLKPGVSQQTAARELGAIGLRVEGRTTEDFGAGLQNLHENVVGGVRFMLFVFLGAVGLVLAIACANVANLALTRATSRQRELALRSALGAGRWRLARHVLTESIVIALAGGAAGLAIAFGGVRTFVAMSENAIPRSHEVAVSGGVLLFAAGVSVICGVAFGLLPVLQNRADRLTPALRDGARGATGGRRGQFIRNGLVVGQVGLAVVLLTGAGLLVNSFLRLTAVDPGFEPGNVLTAGVSLPPGRYPTDDLVLGFFDNLVARVEGLPGVTRVTTSYSLPFAESNFRQMFTVEGKESPSQEGRPWAGTVIVGDDYFSVSGVSILQGRGFDRQDRVGAPRVAVVNMTMAARQWPGEAVIGKRFRLDGGISGSVESLDARFYPDDWITIVGVAADVRRRDLESEAVEEFYRPHAQMAWPGMSLLVRAAGEPAALFGPVQREVWSIDPELAVNLSTMQQLMSSSIATPRLRTTLLTAFAAVAAFLAMIGVYGVMALTVAQRRREIGVRIALGAGRSRVVAEVLGKGLRVTGLGIVVGLVAAVAATRVLTAMLFGVSTYDPLTFAGVVVSVALAAAAACYVPARRASRVDPVVVLRDD